MAYKIVPKPRDHETHPVDVPGAKPTHHRVKMPHGAVIPPGGLVVTALDPHYTRQQQRGEVEIHEGTVDNDGNFVPKAPPAEQE
jgi:hypothetical protein